MAIVSLRAGATISAGDSVWVSSVGLAYSSSALFENQATIAGVAIDGGAVGDLIRINNDAIYDSTASYTPGELLYVDVTPSGSYRNYVEVASGLALTSYAGLYITEVGRAVTTNKINVEVGRPTFLVNPTSIFLLESSSDPLLDAILQEDGTTIKTESAL